MLRVRRALVSLADKRNIRFLIDAFRQFGIEAIATGQTARSLRDEGLNVTEVSAITDFPEILGGRVKTLHPSIHGAILARKNSKEDRQELKKHQLDFIDLVVVNLYDFVGAAQGDSSLMEAIEHIDIGGSALLRAAAKNYHHISLVTSPDDYESLAAEMTRYKGSISEEFRAERAMRAYRMSAAYDERISEYMARQQGQTNIQKEEMLVKAARLKDLRYGENPHQKAALYTASTPPQGLTAAPMLQGSPLSYNNLVDADMACKIVHQFSKPACVIVKHASPCGVAQKERLVDAYLSALAADSESAFGGILAFNRELDEETAQNIIQKQFAELLIAPQVSKGARKQLKAKKNLSLLIYETKDPPSFSIRSIAGGWLKQETDTALPVELKWVTKRKAEEQYEDLLFAWKLVKLCHSNAIVIARQGATCGIGGGQTSRVFSVRCALLRAEGMQLEGAALASDAFFPFADSIELLAATGISAIIQPGGSKRDAEVIEAADKLNIAMAFTHQRAFSHG